MRSSPAEAREREHELSELRTAGFELGLDTDPALLVHSSLAEGVINTVAAQKPSLVLITQRKGSGATALGSDGEAVAAAIRSPVAIVIGEATTIAEVLLFETKDSSDCPDNAAVALAEELATRIGAKNVVRHSSRELLDASELRPGQICVTAATSWDLLASSDPAPGAALVFALQPALATDRTRAADSEMRMGWRVRGPTDGGS